MPKPNLIIAGCQKSGTTWLHASLKLSGQVFGSKTKELNFFNQLDFESKSSEYLKNFPDTPGAIYYMESTPHYFQAPSGRVDIANNINNYLENPKIVVVFRNPVERYQSAYIHHIMQGRLPYTEVIEEFTDEHKLLSLGCYADALLHWRRVFPDLGVFFYDDLSADRVAFFEKIMDFLGLQNDVAKEQLDFRINDKSIKRRRLDVEWPSMPYISEGLRAQLANNYSNDVNRLQDMTGRDLQHWLVFHAGGVVAQH